MANNDSPKPGPNEFSAEEEQAMRRSAAEAREAAAASLPGFKSRPAGTTQPLYSDGTTGPAKTLYERKIPRSQF